MRSGQNSLNCFLGQTVATGACDRGAIVGAREEICAQAFGGTAVTLVVYAQEQLALHVTMQLLLPVELFAVHGPKVKTALATIAAQTAP